MCAARPFDSGEGRCLVGRGDPKVPLRRTTGLVGRGCPEIPTKSPECGQLDAAMPEVKLQPEGKVRTLSTLRLTSGATERLAST